MSAPAFCGSPFYAVSIIRRNSMKATPTISRPRLVFREPHANSMNIRAHRPTGAGLRPDVPASVRSLGLASDRLPSRTFQGTPTRHRGRHAGNFHLVEKEGGEEFTSEESPAPAPTPSMESWLVHRGTADNPADGAPWHGGQPRGTTHFTTHFTRRLLRVCAGANPGGHSGVRRSCRGGEIGIWCGLLPTRHRVSATRSGPFHAGWARDWPALSPLPPGEGPGERG